MSASTRRSGCHVRDNFALYDKYIQVSFGGVFVQLWSCISSNNSPQLKQLIQKSS